MFADPLQFSLPFSADEAFENLLIASPRSFKDIDLMFDPNHPWSQYVSTRSFYEVNDLAVELGLDFVRSWRPFNASPFSRCAVIDEFYFKYPNYGYVQNAHVRTAD